MITIHANTAANNGKVRVTFEMPASDDYDGLYLVGRFHERNETVHRMKRTAVGSWSLTLELAAGGEFRYGYRTLDGRWLRDPASAPASAPFGFDNSFLVTNASIA